MNHHGKLHYDKCVAEFKRATGHSLQDYFEFEKDEMRMFLAKKPGMFRVDQSGEVRAVQYDEAKEFQIGGAV